MARYLLLFALSCVWGYSIVAGLGSQEQEQVTERRILQDGEPTCLPERAKGCVNEFDCCSGTCVRFPWTTMCQVFPYYKGPTIAPSFEPSLFHSALPTEEPVGEPSIAPTEAKFTGVPTIKPSAAPTTKPTSFTPTRAPTAQATPRKKTFPVLSTRGNQIIDQNGNNVRIIGINYFGFEGPNFCVLGLDKRNLRELLMEIKGFGFNALRIPWSSEMLRGSYPLAMSFELNPQFTGLSSLEILKEMINMCDQIGLMVLLDRHSAIAGNYHKEPRPYIESPYYTLAQFYKDWEFMTEYFLDNPSVVAYDIFNEPEKGSKWDWDQWASIAATAGNKIHAINPKPLILIEGVGSYDPTTGREYYWWGGLLKGWAVDTPPLNAPNKLVASPHVYPHSVYPMPWFLTATFPGNLKKVWTDNWAYIYRQNKHPIWIGEFGFTLSDRKDLLWLSNFVAFINGDYNNDGSNALDPGKMGMSFTVWCVNPESSDTDALFAPDYETINTAFLNVLRPLLMDRTEYVI